MATPNYITASTSYVKVDSINAPYTLEILSTSSYLGQTLTILDGTNSKNIQINPIIISTTAQSSFINADTLSSLRIDQPLGFITLQSISTNRWATVNSFPFRNEALSANTLQLNVSTLYASSICTLIDVMYNLIVENLTVLGPINQTSSVTFVDSLTALGTVNLTSSFNVWSGFAISSFFSSFSTVTFASTLLVSSLVVQSSLKMQGNLNVSSFMYATSISSGLINVNGSLSSGAIEVQRSSMTGVTLLGSATIDSNITTLSSLVVSRDFLSMSSMTQYGSISTGGNLVVGTKLFNGLNTLTTSSLNIQSALYASNVTISSELSISSINASTVSGYTINLGRALVTDTFITNVLSSIGNLSSGVTSMQSVSTVATVAAGESYLNTAILTVNGKVSTIGSLAIVNDLSLRSTLYLTGSLSTFDSISTFSSMNVMGFISSAGSLAVSQYLEVLGYLSVGGTLSILQAYSTPFYGTVSTHNLYMTGIADIKGFTLPYTTDVDTISSGTLLAPGFVSTGRLTVGGSSFVSSMDIGIAPYNYVFHTSNTLFVNTLFVSTALSTQTFTYLSSGRIRYIPSSLAVGMNTTGNALDVYGSAYFTSTVYTQGNISSANVVAQNITGVFIGDGSQLSNFTLPSSIAVNSYLASNYTNTYNIHVDGYFITSYSTIINSPLDVRGGGSIIGITGASYNLPFIYQSNTIASTFYGSPDVSRIVALSSNNLVVLNNSIFISSGTVGINTSTPRYTLDINDTLRVGGIIGPVINFQSMRLDTLYLSTITDLAPFTYISSGLISTGNLTFLGDQVSVLGLSTNRIQTQGSTLNVNNFMFLNANTAKIGIATSTPQYSLDAYSLHVLSTYKTGYVEVNATVTLSTNFSSIWVATAPTDPINTSNFHNLSNFFYSTDGGNSFSVGSDNQEWIVSPGTAYNGSYWVAIGNPMQISYDNVNWQRVDTLGGIGAFLSQSNGKVAWNGSYWIAGGLATGKNSSILKSVDGLTWSPIATGGFISSTVYQANDILWTGEQWIATGVGYTPASSILTSYDGVNWSSITTGGFRVKGNALCIGPRLYGKNTYFAAGGDPGVSSIQWTTDINSWSSITTGGFSFGANGIASDGKYIVAVGQDWQAFSNIQVFSMADYSSKGMVFKSYQAFTGNSIIDFSNNGNAIKFNGREWLLTGNNGMRKLLNTSNSLLSSITVDGQSTMMYCISSDTIGAQAPIRNSYGFANWSYINNLTGFNNAFVETNGSNMWVLIGNAADGRCMYNSTDGQNWRLLTTASNGVVTYSANQNVASIYYQKGVWFACGYDATGNYGTCKYSYDAVTWLSFPMWSKTCKAVLYGNGIWVTCGGSLYDGTASVGYSGIYWNSSESFDPDPANWTRATNVNNIYDGTYNGRFYPNGFYTATFAGNYFYVSGQTKAYNAGGGSDPGQVYTYLIYSGDGKSWSNQYCPNNFNCPTYYYAAYNDATPGRGVSIVAYNTVTGMYSCGGGGIVSSNVYIRVFYSTDGIYWLPSPSFPGNYNFSFGYAGIVEKYGLMLGAAQFPNNGFEGEDNLYPYWTSSNGRDWIRGQRFTQSFQYTPRLLSGIAYVNVPLRNTDIYSVGYTSNAIPLMQTSNLITFDDTDLGTIRATTTKNTVMTTISTVRLNESFQVTPWSITASPLIEPTNYYRQSSFYVNDNVYVTGSLSIGVLYVSTLSQLVQLA